MRPLTDLPILAEITFAANAGFDALDRLLLTIRTCRAQADRIAMLLALSDAELADRGLTRNRVVHHVLGGAAA